MGFWKNFEKETKDLDNEIARKQAEIVEKAKDRNKQLEERWERVSKLRVQITKCYLVQVLDEEGNELRCEYSFCGTKKEAEEIGNNLLKDVVDNENSR